MSEFNFQQAFDHIFDNVDLSIDERLDRLVGLLNRLEPALLETAAGWSDAQIEEAFMNGLAALSQTSHFGAIFETLNRL